MSEPLAGEAAPDVGGEVDAEKVAVEQSEGFLNQALEKAGAEREAPAEERQRKPAATQQPGASRPKSEAQLQWEARNAKRNSDRQFQMQQAVIAKIAAALEVDDEPEVKAAPVEEDPEPDPEIDYKAWWNWSRRQIVNDVKAQLDPIKTFFGTLSEAQERQRQEREWQDGQLHQLEQVRGSLAEGSQEYEQYSPGFMDRVNTAFEMHMETLVWADPSLRPEEIKHIAGNRLMEWFSYANGRGMNPFEFIDKMATREVQAAGRQVVPRNSGHKPASEIAQRAAAARTPVAGSLGQGGRTEAATGAASGVRGVLSMDQIKAKAKAKWGSKWKEHIHEITGAAAAEFAKQA